MKSVMVLEQQPESARAAPPFLPKELAVAPMPGERHGYRADRGDSVFGLASTACIYALVLAGFFFTLNQVVPVKTASPALSVFDVHPPASPPETPAKEKAGPKPVENKEKQPEPRKVRPIEPSKIQISPLTVPISVAMPKPADPGPKEPETVAPQTAPAPPAPQVSSNAPDTWEGRVLAVLNKHRRYPRMAMIQRQQGLPYIRFVMDREGKILSSRLERSSGFPLLDEEAVALPKRSQPLPKPPADRHGDTIELVVPVEFFVAARLPSAKCC